MSNIILELIMAPPHICGDLHPWRDNCAINVMEIFRDGWLEGIKMYAPIFIIPTLLFGKRGYVTFQIPFKTNPFSDQKIKC